MGRPPAGPRRPRERVRSVLHDSVELPGLLTVGATTVVSAPKEGPYGRNNGAVVWGDISGGKLTYLAGVFDNADVATEPAVLGPRAAGAAGPGAGVLGQRQLLRRQGPALDRRGRAVPEERQHHGDGPDKDWAEVNVDVLFEKKLGGGSFVTGEGAYYHYNVNDGGVERLAVRARGLRHARRSASATSSRWPATSGRRSRATCGTNPWNIDVGRLLPDQGPGAARARDLRPHRRCPGDIDRQLRSARRAGDLLLDSTTTSTREGEMNMRKHLSGSLIAVGALAGALSACQKPARGQARRRRRRPRRRPRRPPTTRGRSRSASCTRCRERWRSARRRSRTSR